MPNNMGWMPCQNYGMEKLKYTGRHNKYSVKSNEIYNNCNMYRQDYIYHLILHCLLYNPPDSFEDSSCRSCRSEQSARNWVWMLRPSRIFPFSTHYFLPLSSLEFLQNPLYLTQGPLHELSGSWHWLGIRCLPVVIVLVH